MTRELPREKSILQAPQQLVQLTNAAESRDEHEGEKKIVSRQERVKQAQ